MVACIQRLNGSPESDRSGSTECGRCPREGPLHQIQLGRVLPSEARAGARRFLIHSSSTSVPPHRRQSQHHTWKPRSTATHAHAAISNPHPDEGLLHHHRPRIQATRWDV
ncbi:hypothetical protein PHLGIDRAFT_472246 [Phlebiopsis gigantea 11061_1 CR5-6]|uniref:Uncharacterized protein n=1 Tax=Phlebiopsis gigantea (strain 11061_1 CR5-6) TaxID=745531 RepID=A0A0C3RWR2_PHLG1|nr:hypothetical protein PHLGIDRAFT_472246 [Phlebiopsis gigantea 11061_1 CR5-6]